MKKILFDMDGTLINATKPIILGFNHAFKLNNTPPPKEKDIISLIGYPLEIMFEKLGVEKNLSHKFALEYKSLYKDISKPLTTLLPNSKEAIMSSYEFAKLGIVTTKTSKFSKELLESFGLLKYFEVVIGREDVINPKPNKEPVLKALDIINQGYDNAYLIGDTVLDVQAAINANITPIALTSGYGKKEDLQKYTKYIFADSLEAIKEIKKINNFE